jgi:hypothetical protein
MSTTLHSVNTSPAPVRFQGNTLIWTGVVGILSLMSYQGCNQATDKFELARTEHKTVKKDDLEEPLTKAVGSAIGASLFTALLGLELLLDGKKLVKRDEEKADEGVVS